MVKFDIMYFTHYAKIWSLSWSQVHLGHLEYCHPKLIFPALIHVDQVWLQPWLELSFEHEFCWFMVSFLLTLVAFPINQTQFDSHLIWTQYQGFYNFHLGIFCQIQFSLPYMSLKAPVVFLLQNWRYFEHKCGRHFYM